MALKFDIKTMPQSTKRIIAFVPTIIIAALFIVLVYMPRNKEIKALDSQIGGLEDEISKSQFKASKLQILKDENAKLKARLKELSEQLPEEKEVSGLLRQLSDLGLKSGLTIISWRPEAKKENPNGIYYEIPVRVEMSGSYHNLGVFFSQISRLKRIVNMSDIRLGGAKAERGATIVSISFTATTFSAVTEGEKKAGKG